MMKFRKNIFSFVYAAAFAVAGFAFVPSSAHAQCEVPGTNGLVGHWKLDETSTTTAVDSSGYGNDGTMNNGMNGTDDTVPGIVGTGLQWISADNHSINAGGDASVTNIFVGGGTIAAWVKPTTTNGATVIYKTTNSGTLPDGYDFGVKSNERIGFRHAFSGGREEWNTYPAEVVPIDEWSHIAVVYNKDAHANDPVFYINGVAQTTFRNTIGSPTDPADSDAPQDVIIGPGFSTDAEFDDVRMYNRALSADEINALYLQRSNDAVTAGTLAFNTSNAVMQYCDGTDWVMAGTGSYNPPAVTVDGSTYLATDGDLTGLTQSKQLTASFWLKSTTASREVFDCHQSGDGDCSILPYHSRGGGAATDLGVEFNNTSDSSVIDLTAYDLAHEDGEWHHYLFSFDMTDSGKRHVVIDGVLLAEGTGAGQVEYDSYNDDFFDLSPAGAEGFSLGASAGGGNSFNGDIADFWMDFGNYIDLSVEANRRKFISENGMPMYLGPDGSLPLGSAPDIFLTGATDSWHTNKGTGGGFTENGALTDASTKPADDLILTGNISNGLIGYWKLDETTGAVITDYSSSSNDGAWTDGSGDSVAQETTTGRIDNALNFDGDNDKVQISSNSIYDIATGGSFSQFAWFKKDTDCGANTGGDNEVIANRWGNNYTERTWWFGCDASTDALVIRFYGDSTSTVATGPVIDDGIWHHGGWVYDGTAGEVRLYLNGAMVDSQSYTLDMDLDIANPVCIGSYDNTCTDSRFFFLGLIDDVRIYNRALTDDDIANLYSNGIPGKLQYNSDFNVMEYFNGVEWVAMGPVGSTAPPTDQLVAHWEFDDGAGSTTLTDGIASSDGDLEGMDENTDWVDGILGGALTFDGTNDLIDMEDPVDGSLDVGTDDFTLSIWFKTTDANGAFMSKSGGAGYRGYFLRLQNDALDAYINDRADAGTGGQTTLDGNTTGVVSDGQWHHAAVVYDRDNEMTLYLDGQPDGSTSITSQQNSLDSTWPFSIATRCGTTNCNGGGSNNFDGELDDARIYKRALSASEIKQLYHYGLTGGVTIADGSGCSNPTMAEGSMFYNGTTNDMQYCNGEYWVGIGK